MQNTSKLLRAVTAVFAKRLLKRILLLLGLIGSMLVVAIGLLAVQVDPLWAVAFAVVGPVLILGAVLGLVAWLAIGRLQPRKLSKAESSEIYSFTTKLFDLAGRVKTPWPILVVSVLKSVLLNRESSVLGSAINDSKSLRDEFLRLRDSMG